jgi:Cu+-exporting ATPase
VDNCVVEKRRLIYGDILRKQQEALEPLMLIGRQHIYWRTLTGREKGETMPRDPVCGVILDEKTAKFKISHEGETYYFCSVKCKKRFKRNRRKFVK